MIVRRGASQPPVDVGISGEAVNLGPSMTVDAAYALELLAALTARRAELERAAENARLAAAWSRVADLVAAGLRPRSVVAHDSDGAHHLDVALSCADEVHRLGAAARRSVLHPSARPAPLEEVYLDDGVLLVHAPADPPSTPAGPKSTAQRGIDAALIEHLRAQHRDPATGPAP